MSNIEALAAKIIELGEKMAAPAAELALAAVRAQAYSAVAVGVVAAAIAGAAGYTAVRLFRKARELSAERRERVVYWNDASDYWQFFAGAGATVVSFLSAFVAVVHLLDPWVWIAMQRPELWLAKKALGF